MRTIYRFTRSHSFIRRHVHLTVRCVLYVCLAAEIMLAIGLALDKAVTVMVNPILCSFFIFLRCLSGRFHVQCAGHGTEVGGALAGVYLVTSTGRENYEVKILLLRS